MALSQSPHMTDIPQAIRIAGSTEGNVDPALKEQAVGYLQKVREMCEETWQDCLSLFLQGAGAAGPSVSGKDGKVKLETDLRMFCESIVDTMLTNKGQSISIDAQQAMYTALVEFVRTEYVQGSKEGGQTFFRNKLAYTIAQGFIISYVTSIPTFLHPYFELLSVPSPSSSTNLDPPILTCHLLVEIAQEVHDSTLRSAREITDGRLARDADARDAVRQRGDERLAVEGLLGLAESGLEVISRGGDGQLAKWKEAVELAVKALALWAPWIDIAVALTPKSLSFLHRLLQQSVTPIRTAAANVFRNFISKGIKDPPERMQVLRVLDVISVLDPLEAQTRGIKDDDEMDQFRVALGGDLSAYGLELNKFVEQKQEEGLSPELKAEAETMLSNALPLLLRFLSDRNHDVASSVGTFLKKATQPPPAAANGRAAPMLPPAPIVPLTGAKRQFLFSLLEVLVRQLAWPDDAEWEMPGDDSDADDEIAAFWAMRASFRSYIEAVAAVDREVYMEVVAKVVVTSLEALRNQGPSALTWQQAELTVTLVHAWGETIKSNTRAAFYDLPSELATKAGRDKLHRVSINKMAMDSSMSSRSPSPINGTGTITPDMLSQQLPDVYYGGPREKINYEQYPLTPLGQILTACITSDVASYPHPSVPLQYFEIATRYNDFWKSKEGAIQPMLQAMLDARGIYQPHEGVRRRTFYLVSKFISACRIEMDAEMAPPILESLRGTMNIEAKLPEITSPEDNLLLKAASGKSYFADQLHLFELSGVLISFFFKSDAATQISYLEAVAGPLMSGMMAGLERYRQAPQDPLAILQVHHYLMALGHFAKGFPQVSDDQVETLPYQPAFKQMTEVLLQALETAKKERIVRDAVRIASGVGKSGPDQCTQARFAFSQFVAAIGSSIAELVPRFVGVVVTEFESTELVDFMMFLGLLVHRLKKDITFETMDMLLLPLLSRTFAVLQTPVQGSDEAITHRRLKEGYLGFFTTLMSRNLEGVFITERNKPQFENVLTTLLEIATSIADIPSQKLAVAFFAQSIIAWGTSPVPSVMADSALSNLSKAVSKGTAQPTGQHAVPKEERAAQALPGYENFIYQRLVPACFEVPGSPKWNMRNTALQGTLGEFAIILRNTVKARGQEALDFLLNSFLPNMQCPPDVAQQLVSAIRTQPSKEFKKTFADFVRAMKA
ncbi:exportin-T, partial [Tremellales sp. Uapishka_1]